jgi:choline dehydrogenase-like flavoprotein
METFDAIIIGSGAGGAPVADVLVRAGKSVLMLDKGPLLLTQNQRIDGVSDFKRDELFATGAEKRLNFPQAANNGYSYFTSHVEPDLNDEPHVYEVAPNQDNITIEGYTAQVVGGGTQLYGAVSLRFSENDFQLSSFNNSGQYDLKADPKNEVRREVRDWPVSYDEFEPFYRIAEELIGINGTAAGQLKRKNGAPGNGGAFVYQRPLDPNPISAYAFNGMAELGKRLANGAPPAQPYRTPVAVITEDHVRSRRRGFFSLDDNTGDPRTGYVNRYGCPMGLKSSTWVALLYPLTQDHGDNFTLRPNCTVTHLSQSNGVINKVHYRDPAGQQRIARGKVVVVACSAIESVRLLQISAEEDPDGFGNRIHQGKSSGDSLLGKYFMTHCFGGAETIMPDRFDKSISLDSDWASDCLATDDFIKSHGLWAGGAMYNNTSDQALPISLARTHGSQDLDTIWKAFVDDARLTEDALVQFLDDNFGKRLSVSFMANQVPQRSNRIELHSSIRDKWNRKAAYIIKNWHPHDIYLMETCSKYCADVLRFGGNSTKDYYVEGFGHVQMAENARARIANHILGGARFGSDPGDSVLDPQCRAWQFDNLYVTDGAFMPTSGGANPTLTIQANAFRIGETIKGMI